MIKLEIGDYKVSLSHARDVDAYEPDNYSNFKIVEIVKYVPGISGIELTFERAGITNIMLLTIPPNTNVDKCYATAGNRLFLILGFFMCIIEPSEMAIVSHETLATYGDLYDIYNYENSFIIHFESAIIRVDYDLNTLWTVEGCGRFKRIYNSKDSFAMYSDSISVLDVNNVKCEIDYNGNILSKKQT